MVTSTVMVSVSEAREKVRSYFERHYQTWASTVFRNETAYSEGSSYQEKLLLTNKPFSLPLHPPTEQQALANITAARNWVQTWRDSALSSSVEWITKEWKSLGCQELPQRLVLSSADDIASYAAREQIWNLAHQRTLLLASSWNNRWKDKCPPVNEDAFAAAIGKTVASYSRFDEETWLMFLQVCDWLIGNRNKTCYIRELPIRGIDSKWIEQHHSTIEPLYTAMTATRRFEFSTVPRQVRVRFLDRGFAPSGLTDISVLPEEMASYTPRPKRVIVCENLVTVEAMPAIPGVLAIHGGGYAVASLSEIAWLSDVPLWYWGDLDSHGFAILNRLRHHFPHATSLMMDIRTLERYRDLCVIEDKPNLGTLDMLTVSENETLEMLLSQPRPLRLEQERIEWGYALDCIEEALASC